jgi:uncharacterized alpha-E superfamily protein
VEVYILLGLIVLMALAIVALQFRFERLQQKLSALTGQPKPIHITEPTAQDLEEKLKAAYEAKIAEATRTFGNDLSATSTKLSEQVSRLTTDVIEKELEAYHETLEGVRATATEAMEQIRQAVEQQRLELQKGMQSDVDTQKQHLIDRFDAKLGDVVSSYITESLGGGVDLGTQLQYIVTSLEAHKDDIRKDLTNGV